MSCNERLIMNQLTQMIARHVSATHIRIRHRLKSHLQLASIALPLHFHLFFQINSFLDHRRDRQKENCRTGWKSENAKLAWKYFYICQKVTYSQQVSQIVAKVGAHALTLFCFLHFSHVLIPCFFLSRKVLKYKHSRNSKDTSKSTAIAEIP